MATKCPQEIYSWIKQCLPYQEALQPTLNLYFSTDKIVK